MLPFLQIPPDVKRVSARYTPELFRAITDFWDQTEAQQQVVSRLLKIDKPRISLFRAGKDSMSRKKAQQLVCVLERLARQRLRRLEAALGNHNHNPMEITSDVDLSQQLNA